MSKLLINEPPLQVLPSLAAAIGLNEAIFLQQLHYWLARSTVEALGCRWVHNTASEWADQFPFWSEKTIRRTVDSLRVQKLISTVQLRACQHDHTLFYTIAYEKLAEVSDHLGVDRCGQNDQIGMDKMAISDVDKMTTSLHKNTTENTTESITSSGDDDRPRKAKTAINYQAIVDLYNTILPELPTCKVLTDKRKSAINGCCSLKASFRDLGFWEAYFGSVRNSRFHMGANDRGWKADFDWLTNKSNLVKMYEKACQ